MRRSSTYPLISELAVDVVRRALYGKRHGTGNQRPLHTKLVHKRATQETNWIISSVSVKTHRSKKLVVILTSGEHYVANSSTRRNSVQIRRPKPRVWEVGPTQCWTSELWPNHRHQVLANISWDPEV
jgi:hypothetical protein